MSQPATTSIGNRCHRGGMRARRRGPQDGVRRVLGWIGAVQLRPMIAVRTRLPFPGVAEPLADSVSCDIS
jgi:hypothetical protein